MRRLTAFLPGTEAVGVVIAVGGKITRFPSKPRRKDENIVDLINALKRSIANDREAEAARSKRPRKAGAGQRAAKAEAKKAKPAASRAPKRA
jgi:non-homologous end joining protein Ku